jgi:hypothetical protein
MSLLLPALQKNIKYSLTGEEYQNIFLPSPSHFLFPADITLKALYLIYLICSTPILIHQSQPEEDTINLNCPSPSIGVPLYIIASEISLPIGG